MPSSKTSRQLGTPGDRRWLIRPSSPSTTVPPLLTTRAVCPNGKKIDSIFGLTDSSRRRDDDPIKEFPSTPGILFHHLCQQAISIPRAKTSRGFGPQETTLGFEVMIPPRDSHHPSSIHSTIYDKGPSCFRGRRRDDLGPQYAIHNGAVMTPAKGDQGLHAIVPGAPSDLTDINSNLSLPSTPSVLSTFVFFKVMAPVAVLIEVTKQSSGFIFQNSILDDVERLALMLRRYKNRIFIEIAEEHTLLSMTIESFDGCSFSFILPRESAIVHPISVLLIWIGNICIRA